MQDWLREHQVLKKVLVVQLPCHLELLEVFILLDENKPKKRCWNEGTGEASTKVVLKIPA